MVECEITDHGCEVLAAILAENHTIEEVNLEKNKITSDGARMLAEGLSRNHGVRTLILLQQATKSFGDDCLTKFLDMYHNNITLTKITWRLDSRKSFALNRLQQRNIEIRKRFDAGKDYIDLLPDHMKDCPPDLKKSGDERAKQASQCVDKSPAAPAAKESAPIEQKNGNGYPTPNGSPLPAPKVEEVVDAKPAEDGKSVVPELAEEAKIVAPAEVVISEQPPDDAKSEGHVAKELSEEAEDAKVGEPSEDA